MKHIHHISFKHAGEGLLTAIKTQPNFRVHLLATFTVAALGYNLSLTPTEWLILTLIITLVMVTELINTAIEATVDLLTSEHHLMAKTAKDVAAAAVLLAAIASLLIGSIIFLPKLI
jgi:diacylglycerol kinase